MLTPDLKEFIQSLNSNKVRYLVIGSYALAVHAKARYTKDLDIWLEATDENARRIVAAIADFGFASLGLTDEDFKRKQMIQLGCEPNRIDLLTFADGVDFESSYAARVTIIFDETPIDFISRDHLKQNKRATGRHQDLADLEALE